MDNELKQALEAMETRILEAIHELKTDKATAKAPTIDERLARLTQSLEQMAAKSRAARAAHEKDWHFEKMFQALKQYLEEENGEGGQ